MTPHQDPLDFALRKTGEWEEKQEKDKEKAAQASVQEGAIHKDTTSKLKSMVDKVQSSLQEERLDAWILNRLLYVNLSLPFKLL